MPNVVIEVLDEKKLRSQFLELEDKIAAFETSLKHNHEFHQRLKELWSMVEELRRSIFGMTKESKESAIEVPELFKLIKKSGRVRGIGYVTSKFSKERGERKGSAGHDIFGDSRLPAEQAFPEGVGALSRGLGLESLYVPKQMLQYGAQSMLSIAPVLAPPKDKDKDKDSWKAVPLSAFTGDSNDTDPAYQLVYFVRAPERHEKEMQAFKAPVVGHDAFLLVSIVLPRELATLAFEQISDDPTLLRRLLKYVDPDLVEDQSEIAGQKREGGLPNDHILLLAELLHGGSKKPAVLSDNQDLKVLEVKKEEKPA